MYKVELHTHTKYSPDSRASFQDIIASCLKRGINVLAVTDHNTIEGAKRLSKIAPFKVIIGEEILTKEGEVIGLFLKKEIPKGLSLKETIKQIKSQGGIVYLPHPFDKTTRRTSVLTSIIKDYLKDVDVVEVYNGRSVLPWDNKKAERLAIENDKLQVIGSDSHTKYEYGRNYLEMPEFGSPKEFLDALKKSKQVRKPVLHWIFVKTKVDRNINRLNRKRKLNDKYITGTVECDVCGSNKFKLIYKKRGSITDQYKITDNSYGSHHQIVKCSDCGLVFCDPIEQESEIVKKYADFNDPEYEDERSGRAENQLKILKNINKLHPNKGSILDVGCATGAFLELAKKDGWKVTGIEPSKWAARLAKEKYNLPVMQGTLDTVKLKDESFDVIVCFDVIEHVNSPRKLLNRMNSLLKKGGLLCIVTPDKDSKVAKLLGEKWWHIRPDHIFYFTRKTLALLLISTGFKVLKVDTYGWRFSFDYWSSRFKNNIPLLYQLAELFKKVSGLNGLTKRSYSINFRDSMEVYSIKEKE